MPALFDQATSKAKQVKSVGLPAVVNGRIKRAVDAVGIGSGPSIYKQKKNSLCTNWQHLSH